MPREIGEITSNMLRTDRPNIIFGADVHTSLLGHRHLTLLYYHLAQRGLRLVGIENKPDIFEQPATLTQAVDDNPTNLVCMGMPIDGMEPAWEHPELMRRVARYSGFELFQADAGADRALTDIYLLYQGFSLAPEIWRKIFQKRYANALTRTIDCLPESIRSIVADKARVLIDELSEENYMKLKPDLQYLRTREQIHSVMRYMEQKGDSLVLVCRGADHESEFIDIVRSEGLGYLVFEPTGMNTTDPLLRSIYHDRFQQEFIKLLQRD